jgi:LPXTG-site transpeptidase (sortase) family protein
VTDPDKAKNAIRITFTTTNDKATTRVTNKATIDADLNGDGDLTDAGEKNVVVVSAGWKKTSGGGGSTPTAEPTPAVLPVTGFTPGMITKLPDQPKALAYSSLGEIWLEIPSLNVQSSIVGVPEGGTGWDVSWLGKNIGWLNSTAYPTHPGNSLLAGHINDTNGYPGPFANIDKLKYGDLIIIHAWNQEYIYEVRETKIVSATDTSDALKHEEYSWITLVTCRDYDAKAGAYNERYLVRAVLTKVQ